MENLKTATRVQRIEIGQVDDPSRVMRRLNDTWSALDNSMEEAIQGAISGDYTAFFKLNTVLSTPFDLAADNASYTNPPQPEEVVHQTFCGT